MIRRRTAVPRLAGLPGLLGLLLLCALPLLAPSPAGAAAGCCQTESGCFSTDDENECKGTFYQLGFCSHGRCQPTVADPQPHPSQPQPVQQLALAAIPAIPAGQGGKPVERTPDSRPKAISAPPDVAAPPADAQVTPSGLASKVLQKGTGTEHPALTDSVKVHYTGWTTDGKMFDSSVTRGKPLSFSLNQVIPGWSEGVQLMVKGEKRRLWIPAKLAYDGVPDRPQGTLVFDVELLDVVKAPPVE
jgi:FKBP-type peptidyl-prolyl isomerase-like protein